MTYGTATYRLKKIEAYLGCIDMQMHLMPNDAPAGELDVIAIRLENMVAAVKRAAAYSRQKMDDRWEADLRVDAMIDAARAEREAA